MVKIFVVEEEEIFQHMYELLPSRGPIKLLGVSSNFDVSAVDEVAANYGPEVLVLGTGKLDSEVVEGLQQFRVSHPKSGIIVFFSQYSNDDIEALRRLALNGGGGVAVFLKQSLKEIEQILGIILSVNRGNIILDPTLATFMFGGKPRHPFLEQLTPRELEILNLLAKGGTNLAIAGALYIDVKTVEHHLNSMYGKLKAEKDTNDKHMRVTAARLYLQEVEGIPSRP
ncbi:LuxR C-terminal-related transcriptional regulator [Bacteroidota bacterium]